MKRRGGFTVLHVGPVGEQPGGMAQVLNEYRRWDLPDLQVEFVLSTRRRHDPLGLVLTIRAIILLAVARKKCRQATVVCHLSEGGSFVREGGLMMWAKLLGFGTISHIHGASFDFFANRHPKLVELVLRRSDVVAVLTARSAAVVRHLVGGEVRVAQVDNPVSLPESPTSKKTCVLYCGEVSRRKGFDDLLSAWRPLRSRHPEWELVVAGPNVGEFLLDHEQQVRYLGTVPHADVRTLQAEAAIAVLPSRAEALPMFLLESMASECAVIASSVGEIPALLAGDAGVLVEPNNPRQLGAALENLISDRQQREAVAAAGRTQITRRYSASTVSTQLAEIWRSAARPPTTQVAPVISHSEEASR